MARGTGDDRQHERYAADGEVVLRVLLTRSDDIASIRARVRDVGLGGIYIETDADIPPGALADLELRLDGRCLANTLGLVRWLQPGKGAGIEFFYTTEQERDALRAYLEGWLEARGIRRQRVHPAR
ncbi:MAG: PilZ domain-containing protein [Planctomycetota bacterium]|nr:MAG: PilZ domain-containing protein [Planctomycetota bacterium]